MLKCAVQNISELLNVKKVLHRQNAIKLDRNFVQHSYLILSAANPYEENLRSNLPLLNRRKLFKHDLKVHERVLTHGFDAN